MWRGILIFSLAAVLGLATGCGPAPQASKEEPAPPAAASSNTLQVFTVKGVVVEVNPRESSVKIKHEAVADYMPAMTMPFDVKDTNELSGVAAGDPVSFRLLVTDTEGWIDHIQITGPKTNVLPSNGPFSRAWDVERLAEGDPLPEYQLTNQVGRRISTKDFRGGPLGIEFLFTRCPLPNFCPLLANHFAEAQQLLKARSDAPTNWHFLTISFDPEFDTPAVLKNYAEAHGADPARWTFATGAQADLNALGDQFGLLVSRDASGSLSHNLRSAVIDASGRVRKIFVGNAWKPEELVSEMLKPPSRN